MNRKLISLVVPMFNEEENVVAFFDAVRAVILPLELQYDFEFIVTDNHSTDATFRLLREIAGRDPRVKVIRFSRNFGYQRSILTGYLRARGDAAIQLDADLQDPPEMIPDFLRKWEEGYKVVFGVRRERRESAFRTGLRKIFYRVIDYLSEDELPHDAGDFRLIDRALLAELRQMDDRQPYLRGSIAAMGFEQFGIPYDRPERLRGKSKFSWGDLVKLALDGILNHSTVPLRIASYSGMVISCLTVVGIFVYGIGRLVLGRDWPAGFATTTILILFSLSLNALFLGIIGEYLGRIYLQVKKQSLTIVEQTLNVSTDERSP